jgi:hypothetical protein
MGKLTARRPRNLARPLDTNKGAMRPAGENSWPPLFKGNKFSLSKQIHMKIENAIKVLKLPTHFKMLVTILTSIPGQRHTLLRGSVPGRVRHPHGLEAKSEG